MEKTSTNSLIENRWLQFFILLSAPLLTVIDVFIVNISIPSIKTSLNTTDAQVELVIASYLLGYASLVITGGRAGDLWGRKKVFMWAMMAFILTSCVCGIASNPELLILARFFQGISSAFMSPQALSYLQVLFPDSKERTKAIGYLGITLGTASTLGQFLGGYFSSIDSFIEGWRFIFFINLPIGLIAFWASGKYLIEIKLTSHKKFDIWGVVLIILSLSTFTFSLTEGRELGWPWWIFAMLIVSILTFYLFIKVQQKRMILNQEPLIDLSLFSIKSFSMGLLGAVFYFMMHTSYLLISTIFIQNGLKVNPYETGLFFVAFGVSFMVSSFLSIRLVQRFGKLPVQIGLLLMIICFFIQLNLFDTTVNAVTLYVVLFMTGFAGGFVLPSLVNLTLKEVPPQFVGAASGLYNTSQQVASTMGICFVGGIFFYSLSNNGDFIKAFHVGLYGEIILLVLVFIVLSVSPRELQEN
ncbi:MFS transporter [Emticicia oligotrophica]|uniref:MFS transporter n=1 Tax=Emticicia oligotrophica TaxID=312279 RepID=UPI00273CCFB8|nr:MFS transporter [Emticicia oligotrophica]